TSPSSSRNGGRLRQKRCELSRLVRRTRRWTLRHPRWLVRFHDGVASEWRQSRNSLRQSVEHEHQQEITGAQEARRRVGDIRRAASRRPPNAQRLSLLMSYASVAARLPCYTNVNTALALSLE